MHVLEVPVMTHERLSPLGFPQDIHGYSIDLLQHLVNVFSVLYYDRYIVRFYTIDGI